MTELSNMPVDNGGRVEVSSALYTGIAGIRRTAVGGEFAFFNAVTPTRRSRSGADAVLAAAGGLLRESSAIIDGRAAEIIDVRKSEVAEGMLVARFKYLEVE